MLLNERSDSSQIEKHIQETTHQLDITSSEYEKEKQNEHLEKLSNGMIVLMVCGTNNYGVTNKKKGKVGAFSLYVTNLGSVLQHPIYTHVSLRNNS